jgi:retron-type reverse transcriptase
MKGFHDKFVKWIMEVVNDGKVAMLVNDQIGPYFKTDRGVRQGDPISPILFNAAVDVLHILIKRAHECGLINRCSV